MASPSFKGSLNITHISTACAILEINGVNILTDPFFSPAGTKWELGPITLQNFDTPALGLQDLPPIDAILLSHEDHPDNLDELGRQLLDGRKVITTIDGAKKLQPRPGVRGIRPWETLSLQAGGKTFEITGTPCDHLPGGECTGFIIASPEFGTSDGLPNAIYFSGDTIHMEELSKIRSKFHIAVAILNVGAATAPLPDGNGLQITMDGKQAAKLTRDINADIIVPMHYESWNHFAEKGEQLAKSLKEEGIQDKVLWLEPGVSKKVI